MQTILINVPISTIPKVEIEDMTIYPKHLDMHLNSKTNWCGDMIPKTIKREVIGTVHEYLVKQDGNTVAHLILYYNTAGEYVKGILAIHEFKNRMDIYKSIIAEMNAKVRIEKIDMLLELV